MDLEGENRHTAWAAQNTFVFGVALRINYTPDSSIAWPFW